MAEDGDEPADQDAHQTASIEGQEYELVQRFRITVLEGSDTGKTVEAERATIKIGTHPSADLVLSDRAASRFHCEVSIEGKRAVIRDLGSTNGTMVDSVHVIHAGLNAGSIITVGRTRIRFELGTDSIKVALSDSDSFEFLIGSSIPMRALFKQLEQIAPTDTTVLLTGETGTGKEVTAESIHRRSSRNQNPLIVVDCGSIPPNLIESELFGHEKGAFTGADRVRHGAFEAAHSGTLFLDEVGELSPELQPKLLRAIESREFRRIGSSQYRPCDVRIIAATNRNLRADVNAKRFRADLFYRLAVIELRLPALRERLPDMPKLVEYFLAAMPDSRRPELAFLRKMEFIEHLVRHNWPGNVRELRNYIERCAALTETPPLATDPTRWAPSVNTNLAFRSAREQWTYSFERKYLEEILAKHNGNVAAAARAADLDRIYFYRLLWRHNLRKRESD